MSFKSFACLAMLLLASASATANTPHKQLEAASRDPVKRADAMRIGEQSASVCRHCHGTGGNSVRAEVPNLAGQNAAYLLEQMTKFATGERKSSAFMEGMIRALTPDERLAIALFLSEQPVAHKPTRVTAEGLTGRQRYATLCAGCHGASALGTQKIPRLAGQQLQYLEDSLKRYRSGGGERIDPRMAVATRHLSDNDIRSLAAYLSALRP